MAVTSSLREHGLDELVGSTSRCIETEIRQLLRGVSSFYDRELRPTGLRNSQFALLSALLTTGHVCAHDLASMLKLSDSTLSRNLRVLALAGWVQQSAGADRRSKIVSVTLAGRRKWTESHVHWLAAQQAMTQTLGARRTAALRGIVEDVVVVLDQAKQC